MGRPDVPRAPARGSRVPRFSSRLLVPESTVAPPHAAGSVALAEARKAS